MFQHQTLPYQTYHRPFVRDLAFAIACPSALTHWVDHNPQLNAPTVVMHSAAFWQQQFDTYALRLQQLDSSHAYQDLTRFLMRRPSPNRLGFHFEGLIHFWLLDGFHLGYHPFEVLAHNMQLFRGKQTIGELDYILRNHETGEVEHWELAIKFFVGSPPYHYADWVGLNSRDNLALKMTHMQSRQFNTVWVDINVQGKIEKVRVDKRIGVIKGRFFAPITDTNFVRPDWLTPTFPIHQWIDDTIDNSVENTIDNKDTDTDTDNTVNPLKRLEQVNQNKAPSIRRAHYIEWFTKRDFYDEGIQGFDDTTKSEPDSPIVKDSSCSTLSPSLLSSSYSSLLPSTNTSPNLLDSADAPLKMGLYFQHDQPFVIYHPHRDTDQDKF